MARTLNFDAVVVETIDVTKHGKTYSLRDDIPMPVLVRVFELLDLQQSLRKREGTTSEDVAQWIYDLEELTLSICSDIFRHSLPEMTDEELAATFAFEEQMQLVMLFFTTRSQQLQPPRPAPTASSTETASQIETETEAVAPNRATRRGAVRSTRVTALATGSQDQNPQRRGRAVGTSQPRP